MTGGKQSAGKTVEQVQATWDRAGFKRVPTFL